MLTPIARGGPPARIVAKMSADAVAAVLLPDILARLAERGVETVISSPAEFGALIARETLRMAAIPKQITRQARHGLRTATRWRVVIACGGRIAYLSVDGR